MLGTTDVIAFVPTTDRGKARAFYEGVLGLQFISDDGFALVFSVNGIMLRVIQAQQFTPAQYTILDGKWNRSQRSWPNYRKRVSSSSVLAFSSKTISEFGRLRTVTKSRGSKIPTGMFSRFRSTYLEQSWTLHLCHPEPSEGPMYFA